MVGFVYRFDSLASKLNDDILSLIVATVYRDRVVRRATGFPQLAYLRHVLTLGWVSRQWRQASTRLASHILMYEQASNGSWLSNHGIIYKSPMVIRDLFVTSTNGHDSVPACMVCSTARISLADAMLCGLIQAQRVHCAATPQGAFVAGSLNKMYGNTISNVLLGDSLVDLQVLAGDHLWMMLRRCSRRLESLRIDGISATWVWDVVELAIGGHGRFPRLRSLDLRFLDDVQLPAGQVFDSDFDIDRMLLDQASARSAFFSLDSLSVVNFPMDIKYCLKVFPVKRLRNLRLDMAWHVVAQSLGSEQEQLQLLVDELQSLDGVLQITCLGIAQAIGSAKASSVIANVLTEARRARVLRADLSLQHPMTTIEMPHNLTFDRLSILEVHFPVYLGAVSALIQRMPVLRRLSVPYVSTAYESLSGSGCCYQNAVASFSLQVVELGLFDYQAKTAVVCGGLLAFVESLVALKLLVVEKKLALEMRRLIRKPRYHQAALPMSHLKKIRVTDKSSKFGRA
ncbi:hypothetical protein H4R99_002642 [Coemansia sp. RSA 1722]|nr:hypothetical protein LPJ57_001215 [Coemansia sp. RSA 486]KAJ2235433.1 hypothetical protein IWW45_002601 [Coemansia sp. RSA 485]KAJ2600728.1 hypothetical protein GGF39_001626 [Coemansia sp. RSA 1721]KAJ2602548.1 hypothetical protein H4R99_002642 [Coemansia sp. RSA 1722]KAJ2638023.1 hypothetical protein GGF40_001950 [Coemansia sp. RSA 1286]